MAHGHIFGIADRKKIPKITSGKMTNLMAENLFEKPLKRHGPAQNADFTVLAGDVAGGIFGGVVGNEGQAAGLVEDALQGGAVLDEDGGDLAVVHVRLAADEHQIAQADGGLHAVALHPQGIVAGGVLVHVGILLVLLLSIDGLARRDAAQNGHLAGMDGEQVGGVLLRDIALPGNKVRV